MTIATNNPLAEALAAARRSGEPLDPDLWQAAVPDAQAAYAVQAAVAESLGWFGDAAPRAWKSGGPSREQVLTHAPLPPEGVRVGPADFTDTRFHGPLIEIEVALKLAREVSAETAAALASAREEGNRYEEALVLLVGGALSEPANGPDDVRASTAGEATSILEELGVVAVPLPAGVSASYRPHG